VGQCPLLSGNRVVATFTKRVAAANPFDRQPGTPQRAMPADGLGCVLGATWRKPAMVAQKGAEQQLIGPD